MVTVQLQGFLNETDILDPFQYDFKPEYWTESALVVLADDVIRAIETRGIISHSD